jgi:hypothetical protein
MSVVINGPNVVDEWLARLLCIWETSGLNLGPETGYPERGFSCISSVHTREYRVSAVNWDRIASFHFLSNSSFPNPFVQRYIAWATEGVVK